VRTQAQAHLLRGEGCRARREELGLSVRELARLALVDATTIHRFEAGAAATSLTRRRIALALEQAQEAAA
jgi:predicted transcriptional regulator